MKKILLGAAIIIASLSFGQNYPYEGRNDDYSYGNEYYSDRDDEFYFPDDYYYNYPQDYYPQDYYQSYYNDYRNSIITINWNVFFKEHRLLPWQIREILYLNNLYSSFSAWNNFYRYNPDRWYYDRYYALSRIMGPQVFVIFQKNYYHGVHPVVHFQKYRRSYYNAPRFAVVPRYRNVNINIYKVDRKTIRHTANPVIKVAHRSYERNRDLYRNNGVKKDNSRNNVYRNNDAGFDRKDNRNTKNSAIVDREVKYGSVKPASTRGNSDRDLRNLDKGRKVQKDNQTFGQARGNRGREMSASSRGNSQTNNVSSRGGGQRSRN